jgi:hypothetical protein
MGGTRNGKKRRVVLFESDTSDLVRFVRRRDMNFGDTGGK